MIALKYKYYFRDGYDEERYVTCVTCRRPSSVLPTNQCTVLDHGGRIRIGILPPWSNKTDSLMLALFMNIWNQPCRRGLYPRARLRISLIQRFPSCSLLVVPLGKSTAFWMCNFVYIVITINLSDSELIMWSLLLEFSEKNNNKKLLKYIPAMWILKVLTESYYISHF